MDKSNISYVLEALSCSTVIVMSGGRWEELLTATVIMIIAAIIQAFEGRKG